MKAKKKPFDIKSPSDIGADVSGLKPKSLIKGYKYPPEKPKGKIFTGEPVEAMVEKVVKLLRDEAKII
jgi:electron transfer flavoprotein alpha/beta subunit